MALFLCANIHQGDKLFSVHSGGKQCAFMSLRRFLQPEIIPIAHWHCPHGRLYPASKVLSYFFSARHGEARETLQNLCIFFVEPTIQKLG